MKHLAILMLVFCCIFQLKAQNQQNPSPLIFIYDASGSMWGQLQGKTKKEIAATVLTSSVNELPQNQKIGLVAYGHRKKGDCKDVEFLVDVKSGTKAQVNQAIKGINPLGKTPLAYSALQVIDKLRSTKMKATIILVTDGIESCGGNICDVIRAAKKEGIDFKLHIIGFGLKAGETEQLKCAAEAGDGNYYDAADAGGLGIVLTEATAVTVDDPDDNVTVFATKNGKPIDAMVRAYKVGSKKSLKGTRSYRDTAGLYLAPGKYDLHVRALAGSDVKPIVIPNVESIDGKVVHRDVSFDAGKIKVMVNANGEGRDATVHILPKGVKQSISKGRTYGKSQEYEVNPGTYSVKIGALKMSGYTTYLFEEVEVKANEVTSLEHNFETGKIRVYTSNNGEDWDAVVHVLSHPEGKSIEGGRTYGKPQEYELTFGKYDVDVGAMRMVGLGAKHKFETVEVKANEVVSTEHDFKSGIAMIGAKDTKGLIDASVYVAEATTNQSVASGRTYTSPKNNPKKFILSVGTYTVTVKGIKEHGGKTHTFTMVIKAGETVEKIVSF